jgi:hypothetical protein
LSPTDPSIYSAVQLEGDLQHEEDARWLFLSWPSPTFPCESSDQNRYRLTVDPDSGDILFVDEETDIRQVIDERNLMVLVKRSLRVKTAGMTDVQKAHAWEGCDCPSGWSSQCYLHGAKAPVPGVSH